VSRAASLTIFALACSAVCAQEARLGRSYTLAHPPSSEAPSAVLRSLTEVPRGGGVVAGGNVLLFDEEEDDPSVRVRLRLLQLLSGAGIDLASLELDPQPGSLRVYAEGTAAQHAALRKALAQVQQALDAATHRIRVRLLRAEPGAALEEVARARVVVRDGGKGEAWLGRSRPLLTYEQDLTGHFPRVRPVLQPANEGLSARFFARQLVGGQVELSARVQHVRGVGEPQVLSWPGAGEVRLPAYARQGVHSALRVSPGRAHVLASFAEPGGARTVLEVELLAPPAAAPPGFRDLYLGEALGMPAEAGVRWLDELDVAGSRVGSGGGAGFAFSFEEEELRGCLAVLVQERLPLSSGDWALPDTPVRVAEVEAAVRAWDTARPDRELELAWGPLGGNAVPPATTEALPAGVAVQARVSLIQGEPAALVRGRESAALRGIHRVCSGPKDQPPQQTDVPDYGFAVSGARIAATSLADGLLALSWSLSDAASREVLQVGEFPLTVHRRWTFDGEAEVPLAGARWSLVGEALRPDGKLVALYARYAPE